VSLAADQRGRWDGFAAVVWGNGSWEYERCGIDVHVEADELLIDKREVNLRL
jgi:hypothetical protein